jgi:DNA-binding CsgD family transcriptional regulator
MSPRGARRSGADLLERNTELATLRELIDGTAESRGAVALIEGPAGIGKSRLLAAALEYPRERGMQHASARGSQLEQKFGFGVVRQLFEQSLAALRSPQRARVTSGAAALAEPVFTGQASGDAPRLKDTQAVLHGLHWLVANLAVSGPLVIAVDDAHWADAPSLRFLAYLAGRVAELPVVLVLATRPFDSPATSEALDEIASAPVTTVLRPAPLSLAGVANLVDSSLSGPEPEFVEACLDVTKGNPFLLRELLEALAAERVEPLASQAGRVLELASPSVARTVLPRVRRLAPGGLTLARAVAVLGDGAEPSIVARLAGLDELELAAAADALAKAGLLHSDTLEFAHPLVRAAIYSDLPPVDRARQHLEAAGMLRELGVGDEQVALHLLATPPGGPDWVVSSLRRAAQTALERGAPDVASTYLSRALAEPLDAGRRADVLVELGRAELAAGSNAGRDYLRDALRAAEQPARRAEIALELGTSLFASADFAAAASAFEEGLRSLEGTGGKLVEALEAHLLSASALDLSVASRSLPRLVKSAADASTVEDPGLLAAVAAFRVAMTAPASAGADLAERALGMGEVSIDKHPFTVVFAATALMAADRLTSARDLLDAGVEQARQAGSLSALALAQSLRAQVLLRAGFVADAEADLEWVLEHLEADVRAPLPLIMALRLDVRTERGDEPNTREEPELQRLLDEQPNSFNTNFLLESLGRYRLAQNRASEALAPLRQCGERLSAWGMHNPGMIQWRSPLALALAGASDSQEATALAEEDIGLARDFGVPRELGVALRTRALVGPKPDRIELLREAAAALGDVPAPLEHARTLLELGAALRRSAHRADARPPLREAIEIAARLGATSLAQRAHGELVATGARPRRLAVHGVDALTPSERRVGQLAARQLTNREIAQALFVTEKTVEMHLTNVYRKLGISTRSELPESLAR